MSVPTLTLADFLLARIAEDEEVAQAAASAVGRPLIDYHLDLAEARHIARWDPARVLAECEAKRRIVEHHSSSGDDWPLCAICTEVGPDAQGWPCLTLLLLALPYSDHGDYREEWRP